METLDRGVSGEVRMRWAEQGLDNNQRALVAHVWLVPPTHRVRTEYLDFCDDD